MPLSLAVSCQRSLKAPQVVQSSFLTDPWRTAVSQAPEEEEV
jgi:hypothetical protein